MIYRVASKMGISTAVILVCIVMTFASPYFLTTQNIINILLQISITSIVGIGMTFIILTGGIDLSVGSVVAMCLVSLAVTHKYFMGMSDSVYGNAFLAYVVPVGICLVMGALAGAINGFMIAVGKVPAFIMTFGMMSMARGMAYIISDNETISVFPRAITWAGGAKAFGVIPVPVIIAFVLVVVSSFILKYMRFGRYIYAIGGGREALRLSGVNIVIVEVLAYTICGVMCGLSAIILLGRLNVAQPVAGTGYEMDAIGAAIIGGTSIFGGEGKITGTVLGALLMGLIRNGLNLLNVSPNVQLLVIGAIIVVAVFYDKFRQNYMSEA